MTRLQIVSQALTICGKRRVTSLTDPREEVESALELLVNIIDTVSMEAGFVLAETFVTLQRAVGDDGKSLNNTYLLPSDFISGIEVFYSVSEDPGTTIRTCTTSFYLEGPYIVCPEAGNSNYIKLKYVRYLDSTASGQGERYSPLFIRLCAAALAADLAVSICPEKERSLRERYLLIKNEVLLMLATINHSPPDRGGYDFSPETLRM